ncbi:MAG: hypothetical protein ACRD22_01810 [Terriglobia bacterium]
MSAKIKFFRYWCNEIRNHVISPLSCVVSRFVFAARKGGSFFSREDFYTRGMKWYIKEFFSSAPSGAMLGTASPQYKAFPGVAARIHAQYPDAKLIAILRKPLACSDIV